jgi:7 transmembrane helices usually fused to an inactive transglutaminase/Transglutaminase-like superfamily
MNSRALSTLAVAGLLLLGALCLGFRYHARQVAQAAREDSLWRLTYDVNFESRPGGAEVYLALPFETRYIELLEENWNHLGLEADLRTWAPSGTRRLALSTQQDREFDVVTATFVLRLSPRGSGGGQPVLESLTGDARSRYTRTEEGIQVQSDVVQDTIQALPDEGETDAERVQDIFEYCRRTIRSDAEAVHDDAVMALTNKSGTALGRSRSMVALCRAIKIPARLVTGFEIQERSNAQPRVWVEVFLNQSWVPFDLEYGYSQTLPIDYLPVRRGGDLIVFPDKLTPVQSIDPSFSIVRLRPDERVLLTEIRRPTQIFDLTRLPVPMHNVMSLLLLLPFGALITAIMRNVVGIQTFGTFAPALLAMSFIFADWETGLAILIVVVTAGLVGRGFLEKLRLLMVPRLSIILTTVILCVVFGVSLLDYLGLTPSAQAVLLPLVILTIMIERFYVTSEEDGWMFAMQLAIGTLVVAALCYLVLGWEEIGRQVLIYPEVHFLTIAVFIIVGRYAGYRLTELWRFRDMVESPEAGR